MYIGAVKSFTLRFSYTHGAHDGHEIKTRAAENRILYNRISDEADGTASYSVDLPNAGRTFLIGNVIQQGPKTGNPVLVAYGAEGATNASAELYVVNNTFVNDRAAGGTFINVAASVTTAAVVKNNLFVGPGSVISQSAATQAANLAVSDAMLVDPARYDYRLRPGSPCVNAGVDPGVAAGQPLAPMFEYVHPLNSAPRAALGALDVGAYELDGPRDAGTTDASAPSAGDASTTGAAGSGAGGADSGASGAGGRTDAGGGAGQAGAGGTTDAAADGPGGGAGGGCGCQTAPPSPAGLTVGALAWLLRRARRRRGRLRPAARPPHAPRHGHE
jgi:MYXO-CTERM domain-containing protein